MVALSPKHGGFTRIELVVVMVLFSLLASLALLRLFNLTSHAGEGYIKTTGSAFSASLSVAHAQWLAYGQPTTEPPIKGIDLLGSGVAQLGFNRLGWPNAATEGESHVQNQDVLGQGGHDDLICSYLMQHLLGNASIKVATGDQCSQDFCAQYQNAKCNYLYQRKSDQATLLIYDPTNGQLSKERLQ